MIDIGPVPRFADAKSAIEFPIVRDMDTNMYERQDGSGLEVGSYAHRPILHDPEEIPSIEEAALSPTEFPFTEDDFVQQMEHALELVPEIVGDESVGVKYAINGLLSLTPDCCRSSARRPKCAGSGPPRPCGSRRGRASGARSPSGWSKASRRSTCRRPTSPASTRTRRASSPRPRAGGRGLQQDLRDRPSRRAVGVEPRRPPLALPRARARARRRLLRGGRLGAPALVRVQRAAARRIRRGLGARPSGRRAGGRRSSTPSTWRCATGRRCST